MILLMFLSKDWEPSVPAEGPWTRTAEGSGRWIGGFSAKGHKDVKTTEIYTHVMNKDFDAVKGPLDLL